MIESFQAPLRARFDRRLLERLDPFPFWPALIGELVSGRWRRMDVQRSVAYLRVALLKAAFRHYSAAAQELRKSDREQSAVSVLDWEPLASTEARAAIHKPKVPTEFLKLVVEIDVERVMKMVGAPEAIATFVQHRVIGGMMGAEIAEEVGWSANRLEAVQTSWRGTWLPRMQEAFATGGYAPTPPDQTWKKWKKSRRAPSANPAENAPV